MSGCSALSCSRVTLPSSLSPAGSCSRWGHRGAGTTVTAVTTVPADSPPGSSSRSPAKTFRTSPPQLITLKGNENAEVYEAVEPTFFLFLNKGNLSKPHDSEIALHLSTTGFSFKLQIGILTCLHFSFRCSDQPTVGQRESLPVSACKSCNCSPAVSDLPHALVPAPDPPSREPGVPSVEDGT